MLLLEASTQREFHAGVSDAADAIGKAGGWVISHQFYSKTLAVIACQIPAEALSSFAEALEVVGIKLHRSVPETTGPIDDIAVQLSITFVQDGPDFRREVPAFG
ncbi:hypothetical protein [Telmatospirillum siberiense]|uniref:Uncharacterized protein n=1 Tax=Telmatospirillum siberiense TaxID=382514 RepID=A0A2N3PUL7_9PROT|nr:hypothetical protein [Telmatospirillum siberiense]PKU24099.1 hypothetical protein CWS72_13460 [Telmatospirillum siberiense]